MGDRRMCWQLRAHILAFLNLILFLFLFQWQRRRIAARQDLSKQKSWTSRHLPARAHPSSQNQVQIWDISPHFWPILLRGPISSCSHPCSCVSFRNSLELRYLGVKPQSRKPHSSGVNALGNLTSPDTVPCSSEHREPGGLEVRAPNPQV